MEITDMEIKDPGMYDSWYEINEEWISTNGEWKNFPSIEITNREIKDLEFTFHVVIYYERNEE